MKCQVSLLLASVALAAAQQHNYDPHYTFYETNYDFTGKDLNNTKQAKKEYCLDDCLKQPGCHAYSYTDYNGGTCWLKESKGEAVFKVGVVSTAFYSSYPMVCQLQDGVDFLGNDLDHVSGVAKAEDCCDKCKLLDKCRAYSWNSDNGGTCWFKTKRGTAFYKPGVKSGEIFPNDPVKPAYYIDVDFVGHDVAPAAGKFEDCDAACKKQPGCRAYTWTDYQGGTCWLKAKKDKTAAKVGAKSMVIDKAFVTPKNTYANVSFHDNDFKNVAGIAVAEDCVQICADWANGECKAVTWSDYQKGTCWLKHGEGIHDKADGQISYVL